MKTKQQRPITTRYKRTFLCIEPGGSNLPDEQFLVDAYSLDEAREAASAWNAVVIKEVTRL